MSFLTSPPLSSPFCVKSGMMGIVALLECIQAGYSTKDFQPTHPHCFTCPSPLISPAQGTEAAHMQMADGT